MKRADFQPDKDFFIVVDVETSGPSPSQYALLSIGACTLAQPEETFYVELRADSDAFLPEAMAVNKLDLEKLHRDGCDPRQAMIDFEDWIARIVPQGRQPVFTAFNAPFDWMFINVYFHRYLGRNPFGHKALDMKAFFMGRHLVGWAETSYHRVKAHYALDKPLAHDALQDALDTAELFRAMLADRSGQSPTSSKTIK
jgi:DNA polymerase III epsilon subunit-like protein